MYWVSFSNVIELIRNLFGKLYDELIIGNLTFQLVYLTQFTVVTQQYLKCRYVVVKFVNLRSNYYVWEREIKSLHIDYSILSKSRSTGLRMTNFNTIIFKRFIKFVLNYFVFEIK